jgi:hypothetical protein
MTSTSRSHDHQRAGFEVVGERFDLYVEDRRSLLTPARVVGQFG